MADPSSANPSGGTIACPQCQAALPADASFCLRCGTRIEKPAPVPATATIPDALARGRSGTLIGVALDSTGATPVAGSRAAPPAALREAAAPVDAGATAIDGSGLPVGPPRRVVNAHATMMGVVSPGGAPTGSGGSAQNLGGTVIGVASPPVGASSASPPVVRTGQTMQGVAQSPPVQHITSTGRHRREVMLNAQTQGEQSQGAPRSAGGRAMPSAPAYQGSAHDTFDDIPGLRKRGSGGALFGWIFAALFAFVAGAAGVYWYTHQAPPPTPLAATMRTQPGGEQLVSVSIPNAAAGTRVRYENVDHPLDAQGRAEFPVVLPAGRVGYIDLPIDVVPGSGAAEHRELRILVAWRADTDLRKLAEDPPKIHIVFHVLRGSSLWIAGQSIRVSGETGIAELPAPPPSPAGEGDARRDRFPVRVVMPDGTAIEEQYELRVPRAQLRVQEPPVVLLTHDPNVVVRGSAPHAARVRIGGQAATIAGDNFSAVVSISPGSNSLDIVAWSPDGAPALVNLTVYRDVTPETYLSTGGGDRGVAALVARPAQEGARLRVTGTVVGQVLDSPGGRTCQLVVENRTCPGGRCTAWIDLPPGAAVTSGASVEVVGEIRGARGYTTQSGERHSDPVVQAVVVTRRP